jgi:hypothetical protein
MAALNYYKIAKFFLFIPLLVGTLVIVEQFLPYQKVTAIVYKSNRDNKFGMTTYSIDFDNANDQFTQGIYNAVKEDDEVVLNVSYFSKEVKTVQLKNNPIAMDNATNEIYFQLGMALAFIGFGSFFLRKSYYTNKNYKYIVFLCCFSLVGLIRIINLNS